MTLIPKVYTLLPACVKESISSQFPGETAQKTDESVRKRTRERLHRPRPPSPPKSSPRANAHSEKSCSWNSKIDSLGLQIILQFIHIFLDVWLLACFLTTCRLLSFPLQTAVTGNQTAAFYLHRPQDAVFMRLLRIPDRPPKPATARPAGTLLVPREERGRATEEGAAAGAV